MFLVQTTIFKIVRHSYARWVWSLILFLCLSLPATLNGITAKEKTQNIYETLLFNQKSIISGVQGKIFFLENERFRHQLFQKIDEAKKSIHIGAYLFKTTNNRRNPANRLLNKLVAAKGRGVKIDLVLEFSDFNSNLNRDNQKTAKILKKHKIKIRFDSKNKQSHAKLIVVDDRWTFLGSHNLSYSALFWNNEVSVMIDSKIIAQKTVQFLQKIK